MDRVAAVPAFCGERNHLALARVFVVDVVVWRSSLIALVFLTNGSHSVYGHRYQVGLVVGVGDLKVSHAVKLPDGGHLCAVARWVLRINRASVAVDESADGHFQNLHVLVGQFCPVRS